MLQQFHDSINSSGITSYMCVNVCFLILDQTGMPSRFYVKLDRKVCKFLTDPTKIRDS